MELALAVMMVLGIFIAIPAMFGFATAGVFLLKERRIRQAKRARSQVKMFDTLDNLIAEDEGRHSAETVSEEETRETVKAVR